MKSKLAPAWAAIKSAVVFVLGAIAMSPASANLGATAMPVAPFSGQTDSASLVLTKKIQQLLSVGALVVGLFRNRNTTDEQKVYVIGNAARDYFRGLRFASTAVDATVLSGETLLGTFSRMDVTKESGKYVFDAISALTGDELEYQRRLTALISDWQRGDVYEAQPNRTMESMVNAIWDSCSGDRLDSNLDKIEQPASGLAIAINQADDSIKVYSGASAGTLTGKLSDVESVAAEVVSATSDWG